VHRDRYQGEEAVRKIRDVLGPTDQAGAARFNPEEPGQTIMINAAHASDSAENARREMGIVQVSRTT
jgi:nucleoside diphosphate kinase